MLGDTMARAKTVTGKPRRTGRAEASPKKPTAKALKEVAAGLAHASRGEHARLASLLAQIAKLRRDGNQEWDALWETVQQVIDGEAPLYRVKYPTLRAFITANLPGEQPRSVQRNALVAGCFTPSDLTRHGVAWLEEAAMYAQAAAGAKRAPKAIDLDRLKVPVVTRDGDHRGKPARECAIEELRAARRKSTGGVKRTKAGPREKALRAALGKRKGLEGVQVAARAESVGLGAIPWAELATLGGVLTKLKLTTEEES